MDIPTNYKGIITDQPMEKQKQNKELQRADDIGGHNVSGTDSRRLNPSDTFIERKVKEWNNLGFNNIGNKAVSDKMIDFLKSSLQEQREQLMHDQEILVNTILDTKNREIEEQREMIKKEYQGYLKCEIEREEYTEKLIEEVESLEVDDERTLMPQEEQNLIKGMYGSAELSKMLVNMKIGHNNALETVRQLLK